MYLKTHISFFNKKTMFFFLEKHDLVLIYVVYIDNINQIVRSITYGVKSAGVFVF